METKNVPIDQLFGFIAGVIPGATAIYIYFIANQSVFVKFVGLASLGYSTKVAIFVLVAFAVGNSLNMFLSALGGGIGGIAAGVSVKPSWPEVPKTAPWRDPKWRKLAMAYLGEHAPKDTYPMSAEIFDIENQHALFLPALSQSEAINTLQMKRASLASDDSDWMQWYLQLDRQRKAQSRPDAATYVHGGLKTNLQSTAIYLIVSMIFVPATRHWFCIVYSVFWAFVIFAEVFTAIKNGFNPWSTWCEQLDFLTKEVHDSKKGTADTGSIL